MLVTGKCILDKANRGGYAVGAFNVNNMEILQAVVAAAEEENSPVIVSTSEGAISYAGIDYLSAMVRLAAQKASVPVCLHLDHGTTYETIMQCIANGWTSVMIDGSHAPFEENVRLTKEVVKVAHACGVSVEAELGRLGGVEDNISVSEKDARFTDPDEAVSFVEQTDVDSLAIAIGTAHGMYKGEPNLDMARLEKIKKMLGIPIVLHGASGVPEEQITRAIELGVNKINIDTDVRLAFRDGVKSVITDSPEVYDPRKICKPAKEAMKAVVKAKIKWFKSSNKA